MRFHSNKNTLFCALRVGECTGAASSLNGPCPVKDTRMFLQLRPSCDGPLWAQKTSTALCSRVQPCSTAILLQYSKKLRLCGRNPKDYVSHSFCIGATTTAYKWGLGAEHIKTFRPWRSRAYKIYIHPYSPSLNASFLFLVTQKLFSFW